MPIPQPDFVTSEHLTGVSIFPFKERNWTVNLVSMSLFFYTYFVHLTSPRTDDHHGGRVCRGGRSSGRFPHNNRVKIILLPPPVFPHTYLPIFFPFLVPPYLRNSPTLWQVLRGQPRDGQALQGHGLHLLLPVWVSCWHTGHLGLCQVLLEHAQV